MEIVKPAIKCASFHGEDWYKCPYCGKSFEFYDTEFQRGFTKTDKHAIYIHNNCGNKLSVY